MIQIINRKLILVLPLVFLVAATSIVGQQQQAKAWNGDGLWNGDCGWSCGVGFHHYHFWHHWGIVGGCGDYVINGGCCDNGPGPVVNDNGPGCGGYCAGEQDAVL